MIGKYMVIIDLPAGFTREFISIIPSQRKHINRLLRRGEVSNYSLSSDRRKLWIVLSSFSEAEVHDIIRQLPIHKHIRYTVYPLLFNETSLNSVPHLWLN